MGMTNEPFRSDPGPMTLGPNRKHCYACGSVLDVRAEICPKCGVRQPSVAGMTPSPAKGERNRTSAALFALLLGGVGAHKFYLGQRSAGVLYLAFCWTGVPMLVALVEGVQLLGMSDADFTAKYPG